MVLDIYDKQNIRSHFAGVQFVTFNYDGILRWFRPFHDFLRYAAPRSIVRATIAVDGVQPCRFHDELLRRYAIVLNEAQILPQHRPVRR